MFLEQLSLQGNNFSSVSPEWFQGGAPLKTLDLSGSEAQPSVLWSCRSCWNCVFSVCLCVYSRGSVAAGGPRNRINSLGAGAFQYLHQLNSWPAQLYLPTRSLKQAGTCCFLSHVVPKPQSRSFLRKYNLGLDPPRICTLELSRLMKVPKH